MKHALGCWTLICLCLILSACGNPPPERPGAATPVLLPTFSPTLAAIVTPIAVQEQVAVATLPTVSPTLPPGAARITLRGKIYDAVRGSEQPLTNASLEWQFTALDWQTHNGQLAVSNGSYQLPLIMRPNDGLFITARAPGYMPDTARVQAAQLEQPGASLNFALIRADEPLPTVPGSLGAVKLSGIVYNSAHGLAAPIDNAAITLVNDSVVEQVRRVQAFSTSTGAFSVTLDLHSTDWIEVTIAANGYLSTTFARSGRDLAQNPRFIIGLRPAP